MHESTHAQSGISFTATSIASGEPLRLLVIGADGSQRELIGYMVGSAQGAIELSEASTFQQGFDSITSGGVDCALVDFQLDCDRNGTELVRRVRAHGVEIPLIVLVAEPGVEREALDAGANGYLIEGSFDAETLVLTIRGAVERERIMRLLRQSEKRLGAVISSAPAIIYSIDKEGRLTFIEGEGLRAFGTRPEYVIGRSIFELYSDEPTIVEQLRDVLAGNELRKVFEVRGVSLECRTIPQRDEAGNVVSCIGVCIDVTDRVAGERERRRLMGLLEAERKRLEDLLRNLPAIVWELHINPSEERPRSTYVSAYVEKMLGYSPEDWTSDPDLWLRCIHPDDRSSLAISEIMSGDTPESSRTFRMVRKDGQILWVEARLSVVRDETGVPIGFRGIVVDITEQKCVEQRLGEVSQLNRSIVESVNAHVAVIDPDGRIVLTNRGWVEYGERYGFGEALDWSSGQNYLQILEYSSSHGRAGAAEVLQGARAVLARETEVFSAEYQVHPVRGGAWYHVSITPLHGGLGAVVVRTDITERHRAEEASRASQRQFESFMDNSPALAFIKDERGRYVYVNETFAQRVSRTKEELIGAHDFEIWPVATAEMFVEHDRMVLESGRPMTFEERTMEGDREIISHVVKFPIRDASGDLLLCGEAHDVTQRILALESLRKSEERFRMVARATSDIVYDWDLISQRIWWNENLEKLLGYGSESDGYDIEWWKSCLHPDDLDRIVSSLELALGTGDNHWSSEYRFRRANGSYAALYERGYVIYNDSGLPTRMIGAISDRSGFVEAEEALRRSEEEYRRIVETAQEGIWVTSDRGVTTFVNATLARMLGYSQSELVGRQFAEFLTPEAIEGARHNEERRRQGISDKYDMRMIRADGTDIWTLVSASPILDRAGNLVGSLAMVTDITERKKAEEELLAARSELERRVAARTDELASAMRRLEKAHVAQKRFIADASHDLRTPLTVVRAELDLLRHSENVDGNMRESIERAIAEARRLDHLSTDLLTLATLDSLDPGEAIEVLRIDELVLGALQSLTPLARERGITWAITLGDAVEVRGNQLAIERALWNLLDNAIKYSPDGASVTVATSCDDKWVSVAIGDEGMGIPQQDIPKVFERFYRGDAARRTPGTGLGLPIVKTVVESHGGSLWVDSSPGSGTRVTITLPRP